MSDKVPPVFATDVIVVGGGPTGLMLGCLLARQGIRFRLVDKNAGRSTVMKASIMNARSLEILEDLGVLDRLLEVGVRMFGTTFFEGEKRLIHSSYEEIDSPFPFALDIGQPQTEQILEERLEKLGGRVERETELTTFVDSDTGVVAELVCGGNSETITGRFLVGCDGAHSPVRKLAGETFGGKTYPLDSVTADVCIDWDMPRDEHFFWLTREGYWGAYAMPEGRWLCGGGLPPLPDGRSRNEAGLEPTLSEVQELFEVRTGRAVRLSDPKWLAYFTVNQRNAERYRIGNVFLAGDAAHVASPAGALGLNTGIGDAANLAWKLAAVLLYDAPEDLLESYHVERKAILPGYQMVADSNQRMLNFRHPVAQEIRNHALAVAMSIGPMWKRIYESNVGLTWNYRESPAVYESNGQPLHWPGGRHLVENGFCLAAWLAFGRGPHAGNQAPDCDDLRIDGVAKQRLYTLLGKDRHHLLLFTGNSGPDEPVARLLDDIAHSFEAGRDWISVHLIVPAETNQSGLTWSRSVVLDHDGQAHRCYGAKGACLYLIRPDGYIAYRALPPEREALDGFLRETYG